MPSDVLSFISMALMDVKKFSLIISFIFWENSCVLMFETSYFSFLQFFCHLMLPIRIGPYVQMIQRSWESSRSLNHCASHNSTLDDSCMPFHFLSYIIILCWRSKKKKKESIQFPEITIAYSQILYAPCM